MPGRTRPRFKHETPRRPSPALERAIYARGPRFCVYCRGRKGLTVDHVLAYSQGGETVEENLLPCCRLCNEAKHDWPVGMFADRCELEGYGLASEILARVDTYRFMPIPKELPHGPTNPRALDWHRRRRFGLGPRPRGVRSDALGGSSRQRPPFGRGVQDAREGRRGRRRSPGRRGHRQHPGAEGQGQARQAARQPFGRSHGQGRGELGAEDEPGQASSEDHEGPGEGQPLTPPWG